MAKVFRIHQGQDGTGWFASAPVTPEQLDTIKTQGKEIATSIPSPLAQIDLVKSAFQWVSDNEIDGSTAQHKLVSDALDVAQLFFLFPKHKDKLKIISWNPNERFDAISSKGNKKHSAFIETLKIYWGQDGNVYNLDKVNRFYFILNNANEIIGGTSPATLFFAAPDANKNTRGLDIVSNNDKLFDKNYFSLDKRDPSFIKYFYALSKHPNFSTYFPEVYAYLEKAKHLLEDTIKTEIAGLTPTAINEYEPCLVLDTNGNHCEVLGIPLGVIAIDGKSIEEKSDFVIQSELQVVGSKPLIIPNETFAEKWKYTSENDIWNPEYKDKIPYKNEKTENDSVLPVQGDKHYWLTVGNFLEDKMVELPYSIDSSKFETCGAKKHLLPLTPTFFKYFKAENVSKYLTLDTLAGGGIEAKLTIPVKKGSIIFKKTYNTEDIVKMKVYLAILPFLRTSSIDLDYTLALQDDRYDRQQDVVIECFENSNRINLSDGVVRQPGERNATKSIYYKTKSFDCIRFGANNTYGFIVPNMYKSNANQEIAFAIDFGTTNTHIEYKYGTTAERALDVTSDLPIWQSLIDRNENEGAEIVYDKNFESQMFPYLFNDKTDYKFPFRTALTYNQDIKFDEHPTLKSFSHTNNFFLFEKLFYPRYFRLHTKLKWGNYAKPEDKILVESYIDNLLHIVLYKALLLNGNPQTTQITWFYPVSMDMFEQGIFFDTWQKAYQKIFNANDTKNINAVPESIAPYLYYRTSYPGLSLSIDIGGGSSDIAVFNNANDFPEFISSFKFAGNSIFGDGFPNGAYTGSSDNNGFVKQFKTKIESAIGSNANKKEILDDILQNRKDSADFSSFLFSLENEQNINFSYADHLRQNKRLKLSILVFYGAIIYYSANLFKRFGIQKNPTNILLSGTASKTLKIIASREYQNVSAFFKYIFKEVTGMESELLNIALPENPKEITCKGGLKSGIGNSISNLPMIFWLGGNDDNSIWGKSLNKKSDIQNTPYYRDLKIEENKKSIEGSISHFYTLLDNYSSSINLEADYGIDNSAYSVFKEIRSQHIQDYLEQGIRAFYRTEDKHIEETLFFYPLIGVLNSLASKLANTDSK